MNAYAIPPEPSKPMVRLELSYDEARRLRRLVSFNVSIPFALRDVGQPDRPVYEFLVDIQQALDRAGVELMLDAFTKEPA